VLRPPYADAESFALLVDGIEGFGGEVYRQALGSVAPFARQLFVHKEFDNRNLRAQLADYRAPVPAELVRRTCEHLVQTRWGKS
jgi:hypothetical protein